MNDLKTNNSNHFFILYTMLNIVYKLLYKLLYKLNTYTQLFKLFK
jgi:hypothetical protein